MVLISLALDNFKGVKRFELAADGHNVDLYGDNGTGKTTIADAYFWLLFGKDSAGRSDSNFSIIPLGTSGLDCSVRGEFRREDGGEFSLRRVYKQVFTRKNGEAEREYKGNTTDFYVDDVPKPKKDYTAFVSEICDESTLMLLSDPDRFPGKMHWEERRDILIKMFATQADDRKIILAHKELAPLLELIGLKSVDDYAAITRERRKAINRELAEIPGRIDEAEKAKPADVVPLPADGPRLGQLTVERNALEDKISRLRSGETAASLRKEIAETETEIAGAKADYLRNASGTDAVDAEITKIRSDRFQLSMTLDSSKFKIQNLTAEISNIDSKLPALRQSCIDNFNTAFDEATGVCPTCGREYPAEKMDELHAAFNEQKADRQARMEAEGRQMATDRERLENELSEQRDAQEAAQKRLEGWDKRLKTLERKAVKPAPWEETPAYETMMSALGEKRRQLDDLNKTTDFQVQQTREKLAVVDAEMTEIRGRQLNKDLADRQDTRIRELKAGEKRLAIELAQLDNGLHLADEFVQAKAADIEGSVNSAFRLVRWKLFDQQINGGIKACCEATVDGVEYGTNLNSAARLNAGLDIISALSAKMGASYPVWIDNAESVTDYLPVSSQMIRLFVAAADKQLRTEARL